MKSYSNIFIFSLFFLLFACGEEPDFPCSSVEEKAKGISYYADYSSNIQGNGELNVSQVSANYLTFVLPIFGYAHSSELTYNWWTWEKDLKPAIEKTRAAGCKVMLKPHIDFDEYQTFRGNFTLESPGQWRDFEANYQEMVLKVAKFAEENEVELLCFGTELTQCVLERPYFWETLIPQIRETYSGELVYAANWDNYQNITFWEQCDYIGIDAYFPLSKETTPAVETLNREWLPIKEKIFKLSQRHCKPILFTEYGYRSCNQAAWKGWMLGSMDKGMNQVAQANAYEAFYQTFWEEEWVAGGFVWEWYMYPYGYNNSNWSPQGKLAETVVADWYGD